jgi:hypothetical protein
MRNKNKASSVFYCFSPPVMIATFVIEILAVLYVLYKYKRNTSSLLILLTLLCLASFQLTEYFVCTNSSVALISSRLGFVAITFLPVLGLHLMQRLTGATFNRFRISYLYILAITLSIYFLSAPNVFEGYQCTGNYVIFQLGVLQTILYSLYYYGLLVVALFCCGRYLNGSKQNKNSLAVKWLLAGYLLFIVPVAVLSVTNPDTSKAIPSIMCGFAVTLAIILVARIAPLYLDKK